MKKSCHEFYTDFVSHISSDQCKLFAATKKLLNQTADTPFPPHGNKLALPNDMGLFFIRKILDVSVSLDATENLCSTVNCHSSHCSSSFRERVQISVGNPIVGNAGLSLRFQVAG